MHISWRLLRCFVAEVYFLSLGSFKPSGEAVFLSRMRCSAQLLRSGAPLVRDRSRLQRLERSRVCSAPPRGAALRPGHVRNTSVTAKTLVQLQQSRRVAAHDLLPLERRHSDLVHHLEPFPLERSKRRRIGPEQKMIGADGAQAHGGGERRVARRLEMHHLEIMT